MRDRSIVEAHISRVDKPQNDFRSLLPNLKAVSARRTRKIPLVVPNVEEVRA